MSMSKFYDKCGEFKSHSIRTVGASPRVTFISRFEYANGVAEYDGRLWHFTIN